MVYLLSLPEQRVIENYQSYGFARLESSNEDRIHARLKPRYDAQCVFMHMVLQLSQWAPRPQAGTQPLADFNLAAMNRSPSDCTFSTMRSSMHSNTTVDDATTCVDLASSVLDTLGLVC